MGEQPWRWLRSNARRTILHHVIVSPSVAKPPGRPGGLFLSEFDPAFECAYHEADFRDRVFSFCRGCRILSGAEQTPAHAQDHHGHKASHSIYGAGETDAPGSAKKRPGRPGGDAQR